MALSNVAVFNYIGGWQNNAQRNAVIAEILPEGLDNLIDITEDDLKSACQSLAKRSGEPYPINITMLQKQRIYSLILWAKDQDRVNEPIKFAQGTNQQDFRKMLTEALQRDQRRQDQKKSGASYLDSTFNTKLKSTVQWEKWLEELHTTLGQIIGVRGVPLTYVIREEETPSFDPTLTYDEAVLQAVTLDGPDFELDARTVHMLILKNTHEDSDAYTYIKPLTKYRDGRRDIKALRNRYSSDATKQTIINKAKTALQELRYKNEKSFSFEKFSARLQKCYDELAEHGREVNNGDIVDDLWKRIESTDLQLYVASLKVDYQRNQRDYKLILQDIAAEVGNKVSTNFAASRSISATYSRQGPVPTKGVRRDDGTIFIGSYGKAQWLSDSVKPHHDEIIKARMDMSRNGGGGAAGPSRNQKRKVNAVGRAKKRLKNLNAQIAAAQAKLDTVENADSASANSNSGNSATVRFAADENHAGDAFGGRRAARNNA